MPTNDQQFAATMRGLRAYRGLTLRDLASELAARGERGLGYATLRAIEANERHASPSERKAILEALNFPAALWDVTLDDLAQAWERSTRPQQGPAALAERLEALRQLVGELQREYGATPQPERAQRRAHRPTPRQR